MKNVELRGSRVSLCECVSFRSSCMCVFLCVFISWPNGAVEMNGPAICFIFPHSTETGRRELRQSLSPSGLSHSQETPHSHFLNHLFPSDSESILTNNLDEQHHSLYTACHVNACSPANLPNCNPKDIFVN